MSEQGSISGAAKFLNANCSTVLPREPEKRDCARVFDPSHSVVACHGVGARERNALRTVIGLLRSS